VFFSSGELLESSIFFYLWTEVILSEIIRLIPVFVKVVAPDLQWQWIARTRRDMRDGMSGGKDSSIAFITRLPFSLFSLFSR
jgi:hypothetical protein